MNKNWYVIFVCVLLLSCKQKKAAVEEETPEANEVRTPVTVTGIETGSVEDNIDLNATASYPQSNIIKASANGYIRSAGIRQGQMVHAGQPAFTLITKEAKALGNTINKLDPSFHFSGIISIPASVSGYVEQLNHQVGDYVQDGEQLALITDAKSFGFILNVPYELRRYVAVGKKLPILLPDSTTLEGTVTTFLPNADSASQTQAVFLKVNPSSVIPQNIIAKVRITKTKHEPATLVPREAILTNEAQTEFWVMKLVDTATAVKVVISKGLETKDKVEILQPAFSANDKILLSGNYGLPDTAKVRIMKPEE